MEDKLKWVVAAGLVGLVGYAVWQFLREGMKPRGAGNEPWETL